MDFSASSSSFIDFCRARRYGLLVRNKWQVGLPKNADWRFAIILGGCGKLSICVVGLTGAISLQHPSSSLGSGWADRAGDCAPDLNIPVRGGEVKTLSSSSAWAEIGWIVNGELSRSLCSSIGTSCRVSSSLFINAEYTLWLSTMRPGDPTEDEGSLCLCLSQSAHVLALPVDEAVAELVQLVALDLSSSVETRWSSSSLILPWRERIAWCAGTSTRDAMPEVTRDTEPVL